MPCRFFRLYWFFGVLVVAQPSWGQPASLPDFEHFSAFEGLSSSVVRSILQDRQGYLWVGTNEGLDVYDGYAFTPYPLHRADTSATLVESIGELYEDRNGMIWVGTRGGLLKINPQTGRITPFLHDPDDPASLSHNNVFAFAETEPGVLWIGTEHGANRLNVETGHIVRYEHDPHQPNALCGNLVTALAVDARGRLWVGTQDGLCRFEPATNGFTKVAMAEADPAHPEDPFIRSLAADTARSTLWIGTQRGLQTLNLETMEVARVPTPFDAAVPERTRRIIVLHMDTGGILWIGSDGGGLAAHDPARGTWRRLPLQPEHTRHISSESVRTILEDRTGLLWVGLWDGGLYKERPYKPFTTYTHDPDAPGFSLSHPIVIALHPSARSDVIWVGTYGGLDALHPGTGRIEQVPQVASSEIWALEESSDGALWVGTNGSGLYRMDPARNAAEQFRHQPGLPGSISSNTIHSILEDRAGTLWIGTPDKGLNRLSRPGERFVVYLPDTTDKTPNHYSVWPLLESRRDGTLWIGMTEGGLNRYDPARERFTAYLHDPHDATSISGNFIQSLYEDEAGDLWIGTMGRGLNRYDPDEDRFYQYTTDDGLPHNTVTCVAGRGEERWIGTLNGLGRLDLRTGHMTRFSRSDGLPSTTFREQACVEASDGTLYFGTEHGVVAFRPEEIRVDRHAPPVVLTGLDLFNRPLRLDSAITYKTLVRLPYNQNGLTFHFSALHFAAPQDNVYAVKLTGVDSDWQYVASSQRSVTYAHLSPGSYVFRVKASNHDGVWNEEGASIRLVITPPWWRTWWFYGLALLFILGVGRAVHAYRARQRRHLEQTRQRIADDLHDDIGSKMSTLAMIIDLVSRKERLDEQDRHRLQDVSTSARQLVRDLRDTIWVVDTEKDTLDNLIERLKEVTHRLCAGREVRFDAPPEVPPVPLDMERRRHVFLLCKEALHNAVRHADASQIQVQVTYDAGTLRLRIEDDGSGFDLDATPRGRGLGTMQQRAEQVGGRLDLHSAPGQGTRITLTLPLS